MKYQFANFSYASIEVFSEDRWLGEAGCWRVEVKAMRGKYPSGKIVDPPPTGLDVGAGPRG
jgi:hypothetical protein